jgi:hypothetical protein
MNSRIESAALQDGFTAREAGVAGFAELAMTQNTVSTHNGHVFDDTGIGRLADLVRLLAQEPAVRRRSEVKAEASFAHQFW